VHGFPEKWYPFRLRSCQEGSEVARQGMFQASKSPSAHQFEAAESEPHSCVEAVVARHNYYRTVTKQLLLAMNSRIFT
jgi:hypothetical protein